MKEMMRTTPTITHVFLFGLFIFISFSTALMSPLVAFASGAFILICFIHNAVNLPAIRCTEDPLYEEDPQGFFDLKVKFTFRLWAIGIIIMAIIFFVAASIWSFLVNTDLAYSYEVPNIDLVSSLVLFMISLAPFIPATFALMKASYGYESRPMEWVSLVLVVMAAVGVPIIEWIFLTSVPSDYVPLFHTLEVFPFLPLSICALAVSLIATFYLIKSAKKSFTEYIESGKV